MSWLRFAFTICRPQSGYYTVLDPVEFYEWRFSQLAPKGAVFTLRLPPSDIFTEGKIIASAKVSDQDLKTTSNGFILAKETPVQVKIEVGYMPSPQELMQKYDDHNTSMERGLDRFKEDVLTRVYISSEYEPPHLFRLASHNDEEVTMHNFGPLKDLAESFALVREALSQESLGKKGRAHELEEFRRYENAMDFVNNSHLHVDASKMDKLLETSGAKAKQTVTRSWKNCFLDISQQARDLDEIIRHYEGQKWVQGILKSKN